MSAPLIWEIVKRHNSFLRKFGNTKDKKGVVVFSAEPGNLTNVNSYAASGLANKKAIGFKEVKTTTASGKADVKIVLTLKIAKKSNKPKTGVASVPLRFQGYKGAEKVIASQTVDSHYRSDLIAKALKRWTVLQTARKASKGIKKPLVQKLGRTSRTSK